MRQSHSMRALKAMIFDDSHCHDDLTHPETTAQKTTMAFAPHRSAPWAWRKLALTTTLCLAALSVHGPTVAAPLAAGSALPALSLKDQHDKPVAVPTDIPWVLFHGRTAQGTARGGAAALRTALQMAPAETAP